MLVVIVVFAAIFVISWAVGSPDKLDIIGYEGTQNEGFWAQFSDMIIYTAYVLFAATIIAWICSTVYSKIK